MRIKLVFPAPTTEMDKHRVLAQLDLCLIPRNPVKTVTEIGAIRSLPTLFLLAQDNHLVSCEYPHWLRPICMMVLFVICVRLPEILCQKTLQPMCPGISGVRQLLRLIPIQLLPFLPNVSHPLPSRDGYPYTGCGREVYAGAPRFPERPTNRSTFEADDQSPCCGSICVVYTTRMWKIVTGYTRSRGFMRMAGYTEI